MLIALEPDTPHQARLGRGIADLTAEGELLLFMAQFRTFLAPAPPKALADPYAARETNRKMQRAMARGDTLPALANFLIWLALLERLQSFAAESGQGGTSQEAPLSWFESASNSGTLASASATSAWRSTALPHQSTRDSTSFASTSRAGATALANRFAAAPNSSSRNSA